MRARFFTLFVSIISLTLLLPWSLAAAMPPSPQSPPAWDWNNEQPFPPAGPADNVLTADVPLGQPGLSFRYVQTFGVTGEAYTPDFQHLNGPNGLFIDQSDNLYVAEELGSRLLKFNPAGGCTLSIGKAGVRVAGDDTYTFETLTDVAVDGSGNIWVVDTYPDRVVKYNSDGIYQSQLGVCFEEGTDNGHFKNPRGIAFDSTGRLYVSDTDNHRIQVYEIIWGSPVYSTTIGVTGVSGSDNAHFNQPAQIAFDSQGRLYVIDSINYRVQRCTFAGGWTCSTFFGVTGQPGNDLGHMDWAFGITVDSRNNVYIADGANYRVLKCSASGVCSQFAGVTDQRGWDNAKFWWPADVAVDSTGKVYVSDFSNHRIQKFNSAGVYIGTMGVTRVPYVADSSRINGPAGIAVAADGSIYIGEQYGCRLIKLNASGVQQWTVGQAGVSGNDNAHFGDWWTGVEGSMAIDAAGRVYVPDMANHRVQIFTSGGAYVATFGEYGNGKYQFNMPAAVAISPVNGDIYVVDYGNQRVQVFDSNRRYKATLGVSGEPGSDNAHFNNPRGVAIGPSGDIYIADTDNNRVQVFNSNRVYQRTLGVTGEWGWDFGHFGIPLAVAVDSAERVYVVENDRIQVFDASGAYLTTIGGYWGLNTGQMRHPRDVAVDAQGNVYVADRENYRVQKFAPGVPDWVQSNLNGFGTPENREILSLVPFGGQLYAGTYNFSGAQLWRLDNSGWESISNNGFGNASNVGIDHLFEFNGYLYAGIWNDDHGGQVWRSSNGTTWNRITLPGFDPTNSDVLRFASFNNRIYAATWSNTIAHGTEIWRSNTGNSGEWEKVVDNGFNDANNQGALAMESFAGNLYVGTFASDGCEVWRSRTGNSGDWIQVNAEGFGEGADNRAVTSFAVFNGALYASTRNANSGGQVWRAVDGLSWTKVVNAGFGDTNNYNIDSLTVFEGNLYATTYNLTTGMEVWRTADGIHWMQINPDGFGDSNNSSRYYNSTAVFNNHLFVGTWNRGNGGEVWQYVPSKIKVNPASKRATLSAGNFTVDITAEDVQNLAAFQVTLTYSPTVVHVTTVTLGSLLGSTGRTVSPVGPLIDNVAGRVTFGAFTFGMQPGVNGNGVLATITFQPQARGSSALHFQDLQAADPDSKPLSTVTQDGSIHIITCFGDFDGDNDVDIFDLQLAASHWNCRVGDPCYDIQFDAEPDGDIDVFDLQRAAAAWGGTCTTSQALKAAHPLLGTVAAGLSLLPANLQVTPGSLFTLTVHIHDAATVGAFQTDVLYDPAVLHVEGITIGPFLSSTGRTVMPLGPSIDNASGRVTFGALTYGTHIAASGAGDLAYISLRAQALGQSTLSFQQTGISDPQGNPLSLDNLEGSNVMVTHAVTPTPTQTHTPTPTSVVTPIGYLLYLSIILKK